MNDLRLSNLRTILPDVKPGMTPTPEATSSPFSDFVKKALADTNRQMVAADQAIDDLARGNNQDIHKTMIAMQKAEISFELVMQIRNKLMSAYDEIRRMPL